MKQFGKIATAIASKLTISFKLPVWILEKMSR